MPRTTNKPGTERFRDEPRKGGPRMHGGPWHDHAELRDLEPEVATAPDAVPEAESSGERAGIGKGRVPRKTKGRLRQMQTSPRIKGKPGEARETAAPPRGTRRSGSSSR